MTRTNVVRKVNMITDHGSKQFSILALTCCLTTILALSLFLLCIGPRKISASLLDDPPALTAVSPTEGSNSEPTALTVTGMGFTGTPTITLGIQPLVDATLLSSTTLTATVPPDLPGGTYDLSVTNPDGQSASLAKAYTVLLDGDGSLSLWEVTSSLTIPRWSFAAVSAGGYIYALGGWPATVERAMTNPDGSLGSWQAISSMPGEWSRFAAVAESGHIYALGGTGGDGNDVIQAAINADGSLGAWQAASSMTTDRECLAAVAAGGYLYAIGGNGYDDNPLSSVERAKINPDGSLGPWEAATPMTEPRSWHAAVAVGSYVYAMGGYGMSSVERASVNPDSSLSAWEPVNSMTIPRCAFGAVTARGYIYALAGRESWSVGSPRYSSVERAKVNTDGSIDPWQAVTSITRPRSLPAAVATRGCVYVLGGLDEPSIQLSSVERAEIVDGMLPTGHGVSINDGALFTNQVTVTLTIGLEPGTRQMQVSNDGGFAGAKWEPYSSSKVWQITRYGDYVIPRVVYVRYKDVSGNISSAYQDDIILDVNAPTGSVQAEARGSSNSPGAARPRHTTTRPVTSANDGYSNTIYLPLALNGSCTLPTGPANLTLRLEAQDDVSGVADMMISHLSDCRCGTWESYSTTKAWYAPEEATTIYVRFRDNAGNVSEIVTDTIPTSAQ